MVITKKYSSVITSPAYDTFWKFAFERQNVFFKRVLGNEHNLTSDKILQQYKFTNAYRASDRVSQYLIKNVIYSKSFDTRNTIFRILLFKLFNKIETWELLEKKFGGISLDSYSSTQYSRELDLAMSSGKRIYSNAYMMASGAKEFPVAKKHHAHFLLLDKMLKENLPEKIEQCNSMEDGYKALLSYPMIGQFLAYQYITDINYSEVTKFSETEFTVPGPGAKDGIKKCFISTGEYSDADIIKLMTERQEDEFHRLGLKFKYLSNRKLQYIDIQNLFCETDKYCRVAHPDLKGFSGRTKIKQKFKINKEKIDIFYPPKWKVRI